MTTPQIYVACLAAYNSGHLHGEWIEVDDVDTIKDAINTMLSNSPIPNAEEWEIHDIEGLPSGADGHSLEDIVQYADFIKEHGELGEAVLDHCCGDIEQALNLMENYNGEFKNEEDFAVRLVEDCYDLKPMGNLQYYFDYAAFARDLFMDGYVSIYLNGDCHVFS
jgi:antirestriction protein